ncbi:MAG: translation initiation factor IF-3 [Nevskiales bacterium]
MSEKHDRRNEEISAPRLRVIAADGSQLGLMSRYDALQKALESGMDLVEISPNAEPPVAKVMDYGKYLYKKDKEAAAARKKLKQIQTKEIKIRPNTDKGDYATKLRQLIEFLEEGDKIKVTLRFRGRELAHQDLGMEMMNRLKTDLLEFGNVVNEPRTEGKMMVMVMAPKPKK